MQGFNSTVFIYGMTGAGKTYTMFNQSEDDEGIIGLTISRLFECFEDDYRSKYQIELSFYEIYN